MRGPGIHDDDDIQSRHEHDGDELRESNASRGAFSDSRGPAGSRPSAGAADGQRLPHHSEGLGECGGHLCREMAMATTSTKASQPSSRR